MCVCLRECVLTSMGAYIHPACIYDTYASYECPPLTLTCSLAQGRSSLVRSGVLRFSHTRARARAAGGSLCPLHANANASCEERVHQGEKLNVSKKNEKLLSPGMFLSTRSRFCWLESAEKPAFVPRTGGTNAPKAAASKARHQL